MQGVILSDVLIPYVVSSCATHLNAFACSNTTFGETSGGGTDRLWWLAVVVVYCGVDEQLVSRDTGHRKSRKRL